MNGCANQVQPFVHLQGPKPTDLFAVSKQNKKDIQTTFIAYFGGLSDLGGCNFVKVVTQE